MHLLSYSADGITQVVLNLAIWAWDLKDDNYFINLFWFNATFMYVVLYITKALFHAGRPYLDDIELGDTTMSETVSAEFGCPSGHSILVWSSVFNLLRWYTEDRELFYYNRNPKEKARLYKFCTLYVCAVGYSRIYVGRHTLDQIIVGFMLGHWCNGFTWNIMKPALLDLSYRHENQSK